MIRRITYRIRRFAREEDGTQLVEFTLILPMLLLIFAVIIEGGRLMWSYQAAAAGVRDATRYISRVVPSNICDAGGSVASWGSAAESIVKNRIDGNAIFPSGINVTSVTPSLACVNGTFRVANVGVVAVTANVTVTFPFAGIFQFAGGSRPTLNTSLTDRSRIFGT